MSEASKLEPFTALVEAYWAYQNHLEGLDDKQLGQHHAHVAVLGRTNCWYAEYGVRGLALKAIDGEQRRRRYVEASGGSGSTEKGNR